MQEQLFCQELWPMGDSQWSSLFLKDCTPWIGPALEKVLQKHPTLKQVLQDCNLW